MTNNYLLDFLFSMCLVMIALVVKIISVSLYLYGSTEFYGYRQKIQQRTFFKKKNPCEGLGEDTFDRLKQRRKTELGKNDRKININIMI